ncbi:hypothetical protein PG997_002868 [Apiospora hydei]|uniref:Heterokaryon incompatibility domain-containing protein n=1 Tax=Apiospora hydei TaxID=1337664 RepID=A0ABR1WXM4_9PEZI
MNHIIPAGDTPHPSVGFFARQRVFEPDDFFTIPVLYGFDSVETLVERGLLAESQLKNEGKQAVATFLQEWLWFAFLARMTHQKIDSNDFVDGNRGLDTTRLKRVINTWVQDEGGYYKEHQHCTYPQHRYIKGTLALGYARRFLVKHLSYEARDTDTFPDTPHKSLLTAKDDNSVHNDVAPELTLSIAILGQILQAQRSQFRGDDIGLDEAWRKSMAGFGDWGYSRLSRERMLGNHWCPSLVRKVESTMTGSCEVYFASSLTAPDCEGHDLCNIFTCKKSYKRDFAALHMRACDKNCGTPIDLGPGILDGKVSDNIAKGLTPLVTYSNGRLTLQLQHDFNTLVIPSVMSQSADVPFWIDVICLPTQVKSKNLALAQLRNIFSQAKATIVWDRNFIMGEYKTDIIKMNVQLRLGVWSRRLWTLLEAVLSKDIHLAFGDGRLSGLDDLNTAKQVAKRTRSDPYHYIPKAADPFTEATWSLRKALQEQPHEEKAPRKQKSLVLQAWLAVQFYGPRNPEDEPFILASMLGLDPKPVLEIQDARNKDILAAKRMVCLLDGINMKPNLGIPAGIIFLPPPQLTMEAVPETRGYNWAPRTWLSKQAHPFPPYETLQRPATLGKQGLIVDFSGIQLHAIEAWPHSKKFFIPLGQSMHEWLKVDAQSHKTGQADQEKQTDEDWVGFWKQEVGKSVDPNHPLIVLSSPRLREQWDIGVLVRKKGTIRNGQIRWVEQICRVRTRLETNPAIIQKQVNMFRGAKETAMFGTRLDECSWCIDGGS